MDTVIPDMRLTTEAEADQQATSARVAKSKEVADHEELHRTMDRIQGRRP